MTNTEASKPDAMLTALLESGAHFGHRSSRWNPNMRQFIYGTRHKMHIIDLKQTKERLNHAISEMKKVIENGGQVLFVGTKKQAKDILPKYAKEMNQPYVVNRWLGGTLTNSPSIKARVRRMKDLEKTFATEDVEKYTKKEKAVLQKELTELQTKFDGIRDMKGMPTMMFAIDIKKDFIAIKEAQRKHIPVTSLADTNTNPTLVQYAIPCNDDAVRALDYVMSVIAKELSSVEVKKKEAAPKGPKPEQRRK